MISCIMPPINNVCKHIYYYNNYSYWVIDSFEIRRKEISKNDKINKGFVNYF